MDASASGSSVGWAELAAGPATVTSLRALTEVDPTTLGGADAVDAIVCAEKATSLLLGVQAQLMARLATPFVAGDPMRLAARLARRSGLTGGDDYNCNVQAMVGEAAQSLAASEVAAALRIAPVTAGIRIREAQHLTQEFTPARRALEQGLIDRGKLRAIVDRVQVLPTEHIGPVLDQLLPETAAGPPARSGRSPTRPSSPPTPRAPPTATGRPPPAVTSASPPTPMPWPRSRRSSPPTAR